MLRLQRYTLISLFVISGLILSTRAIVFAQNEVIKSDSATEDLRNISDQSQALFLFAKNQPFYTSRVVHTNFAFENIGFKVRGGSPGLEKLILKARFRKADQWSDWVRIDLVKIEKQDFYATEEPLFIHSSNAFQYSLQATNTNVHVIPNIDSIESIYFQPTISPVAQISRIVSKKLNFLRQIAHAGSDIKIITRAEWGADESYRMTSSGGELWPAQTSTPKKFIIHHTAGSDGSIDPSATIRGIYYWHARVLGWGDIGYNYLIDQQGNRYEGRIGGDGVIGAHAYNSETNINHNVASIGIAVLGCYETTQGACSTLHTPSIQMIESLVSLIQSKAKLWNIEPSGTSEWHGIANANVLGHKDVDKTYCPGDIIYSQLSSIAMKAQNGFAMMYQGEYVEQTMKETDYINNERTITIRIKNAGSEIWKKNQSYLEIFDNAYKVSRYKHTEWSSTSGKFQFNENEVAPGAIATFIAKLKNPNEPGLFDNIWRLTANNHTVQSGERIFKTKIISPYRAEIQASSMRKAVSSKWQPKIKLQVKNVGDIPWTRRMVVDIYGANKSAAPFSHASWNNSQIGEISLKQRQVKPGETGTFEFRIKPPKEKGVYMVTLSLRVKNKNTPIENSEQSFQIRVD